MRLYSKGWQSKYIPEVLTRGLVPSTLAAYCKQQLKWTCGTFELLFREYPKLFRGFTFWQRLHYFMAPLYYLRGVFGLVDIAVPIVCLLVGGVALRIDLLSYLNIYAPLAIIVLVLRQITQRWVIEKCERGFHLTGGVLAMGCWWVFLQGFLCAVFRLKVPYVPTPKDDTPVDSWRFAMPNLIAAALSIAAIVYGLSTDWTPFSLLMAAFALSNAVQLLFVATLGQQRTLQRIRHGLARVGGWMRPVIVRALIDASQRIKHMAHHMLREHPLIISLLAVAAALIVHFWPKSRVLAEAGGKFKDTGGFYVGAALPEADRGAFPAGFEEASRHLNARFRLFPFTQKWGPNSLANFPEDAMREARLRGAVPLITWEPWTSTFPELRGDPELGRDRGVCAAILRGVFDDYLERYAEKIRNFGDPVLICFAPRADDPASPWSATGGNTPEKFVQAWIYVVSIFDKMGAANAGWVWSPSSSTELDSRFPGRYYVDWINLPAFNKGKAAGGQWHEFADLYKPYRGKILEWKLPVMLTDFGSTGQGGSAARWIANACSGIVQNFPEIRGLVLSGEGTLTKASPDILSALREGLASAPLRVAPPIPKPTALWRDQPRPVSHSTAIAGSPGQFVLTVDGKPFYIRAVAYNPGHDWRDGNNPPTRRQLLSDFTSIQAMGANTIRRYGGGWYDRNIFNAAKDYNLHVIYGFWFGQHIDYIADSGKLAAYQTRVEDAVLSWRNKPSLLAWSLGNEVWGLLKHHFAQPYLTEVRHAHIDFVEKLARRIHELDPTHPVFAANEHSSQLAGALADFARGAPSLDFVGVNSYYQPRIADLRRITSEFDPARPYLVSEFGPDGYWDAKMTPHDPNGAVAEPLSSRKAYDYVREWNVFVEPNRGANIGGVAYCWRDRLEATASWFGLTDSLGREKPAYHALQRLWTGKASAAAPLIVALDTASKPLRPGETINVNAKMETQPDSTGHYHWELQTSDFEDIGRVSIHGDGTSARVTLPNKPGLYRLYFSVNDDRTADIANVALTVTDRPSPERLALEARQGDSPQIESMITTDQHLRSDIYRARLLFAGAGTPTRKIP